MGQRTSEGPTSSTRQGTARVRDLGHGADLADIDLVVGATEVAVERAGHAMTLVVGIFPIDADAHDGAE